jgi:hypothetical protein
MDMPLSQEEIMGIRIPQALERVRQLAENNDVR